MWSRILKDHFFGLFIPKARRCDQDPTTPSPVCLKTLISSCFRFQGTFFYKEALPGEDQSLNLIPYETPTQAGLPRPESGLSLPRPSLSSLSPAILPPSPHSHSTSLSDSDLPPLELLYYLRAQMSTKATGLRAEGRQG